MPSKSPSVEPQIEYSEAEYANIELNRGAPARKYLDNSLNPELLNGLREIAKKRPKDPVKWLGKYLVNHSE